MKTKLWKIYFRFKKIYLPNQNKLIIKITLMKMRNFKKLNKKFRIQSKNINNKI